ncbi:hypothetical protein QJQ45_000071 [Haematococcus lacustris]|nr:hypothetical protein QJQ45_000071 [Haematococcus lacustris]
MAISTAQREAMGPPPSRAPRTAAPLLVLPGDVGHAKAVLPEEDFTAGVEAIIERDYFPDIPKMRNQLEWVQAQNSGDPAKIRAAQINIARRRAGLMTPAPGNTPALQTPWGETPSAASLNTPAMTPLLAAATAAGPSTPALHSQPGATPNPTATPGAGTGTGGSGRQAEALLPPGAMQRAPPMRLDTFLATHTSEDNASFLRIQEKHAQRKRQRCAHLLEDPAAAAVAKQLRVSQALALHQPGQQPAAQLLLEEPGPGSASNPTDEFGTGGQEPMTLVPVKHAATTALYYVPDQQPLSPEEAGQLAKQPAKVINTQGTRLSMQTEQEAAAAAASTLASAAAIAAHRLGQQPPPLSAAGASAMAPTTTPTAGTPAALAASAAVVAAARGGAGGAAGAQGWDRMGTPALTPGGLGASPLMTWGDLASTPLRLDGMEEGVLDMASLQGPSFSVPHMPKREAAGHQLASAKTITVLRKMQRAARQAEEWGQGKALPPGAGAALAGGLHGVAPHSAGPRPTSGYTPGGGQGGRPGTGAATPLGLLHGAHAGVAGMSAAAQKLAHAVHARRTGGAQQLRGGTPGGTDLDRMLRASYAGARPASGAAGTPGGHKAAPSGLAGAEQGQGRAAGGGSATPLLHGEAGVAAEVAEAGGRAAAAPRARQLVSVGPGGVVARAGGPGKQAAPTEGLTDNLLRL